MDVGRSYRQRQVGTIVGLALTAEHNEHGVRYLPREIDLGNHLVTVIVP